MKLVLFLFILLALVAFGGNYLLGYVSNNGFSLPFVQTNNNTGSVTIKDQTFSVQVADTDEKRQIGLSETQKLEENEGMLFLFDSANTYSFWMKNMNFPIDIIYINDNKIIKIFKNVPVENGNIPTIYTPDKPANRVLEINAGLSEKYNFQEGDQVKIENPS